jgi:hypothetical protein
VGEKSASKTQIEEVKSVEEDKTAKKKKKRMVTKKVKKARSTLKDIEEGNCSDGISDVELFRQNQK